MKIKSLEFSELDIGGRETCIFFILAGSAACHVCPPPSLPFHIFSALLLIGQICADPASDWPIMKPQNSSKMHNFGVKFEI